MQTFLCCLNQPNLCRIIFSSFKKIEPSLLGKQWNNLFPCTSRILRIALQRLLSLPSDKLQQFEIIRDCTKIMHDDIYRKQSAFIQDETSQSKGRKQQNQIQPLKENHHHQQQQQQRQQQQQQRIWFAVPGRKKNTYFNK